MDSEREPMPLRTIEVAFSLNNRLIRVEERIPISFKSVGTMLTYRNLLQTAVSLAPDLQNEVQSELTRCKMVLDHVRDKSPEQYRVDAALYDAWFSRGELHTAASFPSPPETDAGTGLISYHQYYRIREKLGAEIGWEDFLLRLRNLVKQILGPGHLFPEVPPTSPSDSYEEYDALHTGFTTDDAKKLLKGIQK